MHPDRLSYLASRRAPHRAVLRCEVLNGAAGDSVLTLECGHTISILSHFDATTVREHRCRACGAEIVKTSAEFSAEFAE